MRKFLNSTRVPYGHQIQFYEGIVDELMDDVYQHLVTGKNLPMSLIGMKSLEGEIGHCVLLIPKH